MGKDKHTEKIKFNRPVIEQNNKKSKRNKHITECSIIRMKNGCGICGSTNLAQHGVCYCTECEYEIYYFINKPEWTYDDKEVPHTQCECNISREHKIRGRIRVYNYKPEKYIYINVCMDCGATQSNYCPVCGITKRQCWKSSEGRLLCQICNYRNTLC